MIDTRDGIDHKFESLAGEVFGALEVLPGSALHALCEAYDVLDIDKLTDVLTNELADERGLL